eukprot:1456487-Ditylum_brightwellii.AAC.1
MTETDKEEFAKANILEFNTHTEQKHWKIVPCNEVLEGVKILSAVWAMKHKQDTKTATERSELLGNLRTSGYMVCSASTAGVEPAP